MQAGFDSSVWLAQCIIKWMEATKRLPYVWDYDLDESQFREILEGRRAFGQTDAV